jgi:hypothetical protein
MAVEEESMLCFDLITGPMPPVFIAKRSKNVSATSTPTHPVTKEESVVIAARKQTNHM